VVTNLLPENLEANWTSIPTFINKVKVFVILMLFINTIIFVCLLVFGVFLHSLLTYCILQLVQCILFAVLSSCLFCVLNV